MRDTLLRNPPLLLFLLAGLSISHGKAALAQELSQPINGAEESPSAAPHSLKETLKLALENSPILDTAKRTQIIRRLETKNAFFKFFPSLDLTTTAGLQNNIPIASGTSATPLLTGNPSSPWSSSLSLGLTETLYDNGDSGIRSSIAQLNEEWSELQFRKTRDTLVLDVATEFYQFSLATALLEVRKKQQSVLDKQFQTLSGQYHQGFKTKSDFLRLKAQVQRTEIERISAENEVALSVTHLLKFMGIGNQASNRPFFRPLKIEETKVEPASFPQAVLQVSGVYEAKMAQIQEAINGKSVDLVRSQLWPRVNLAGGLIYSNQNFVNSSAPFASGNQLSWNALMTLDFNFLDWGSRRRDAEVAVHNEEIQRNSLRQGLLEVDSTLRSLMADLSRIQKTFKLSRDLLEMEDESNRTLETQYREGKVSYLDLITSLNTLLDAKVAFFSSHFGALQGLAKYHFYEGTLYGRLMGTSE